MHRSSNYWPGSTKRRIRKTKTNLIEDEFLFNSKDEDEDELNSDSKDEDEFNFNSKDEDEPHLNSRDNFNSNSKDEDEFNSNSKDEDEDELISIRKTKTKIIPISLFLLPGQYVVSLRVGSSTSQPSTLVAQCST